MTSWQLFEVRELVADILDELSEIDAPNVLIHRRTPAFMKKQAD